VEIACLQAAGVPGDVEANLAALDVACAEAAGHGADLLVTDEMFVTGYDIGPLVHELARQDLLARVQEIARRHGVAVVAGLPELDGGDCYNTAALVGPDGTLLARHRKAHLFGALDRAVFAAGDDLVTVVDLAGVRIALLICYDVEFPESVRAAATAGAHLVLVPTAQMEPFGFIADELIRVRAWENQVYVAYVNHDGREGSLEYVGGSSVVAPSGEVLAAAGHGDVLLHASVDPDVVAEQRRANPYLADRRPELYGGLARG